MRSGFALIAVIALAGCQRLFDVAGLPTDGGNDGQPIDGPAVIDGPPGCITIGMNGSANSSLPVPGFYQRCLLDPGMDVTLDNALSTGGSMCNSAAIDGSVCAIVGRNIIVQGAVDVVGPLPLVLVATDTITVSGALSVSSHPNIAGAGADWAACNTLALAGAIDGEGGAGGTLDPNYPGGYGGASQSAGPAPVLTKTPFGSLHGGCEGGTGGVVVQSPTDSGGAVYLMAKTIIITGGIEANGADGAGGSMGNGGGYGGGSGGMIALDAATIQVGAGMLRALGGGGGGGGARNCGGMMGVGGMGGMSADTTAGYGGNGYQMPNQAFSGGNGTVVPTGLPGGGGGGGGGAGGILLFTMGDVSGGSFDPPPIQ